MPFMDIFLDPVEKTRAEQARTLRKPIPTRMGFTQQEIEQNPELQRMRMSPIEMGGFRGALQTRQQAEMGEKLKMLYEKANASIDEMQIDENMKPLLKSSVFGGGPKRAIDFLEARMQHREGLDTEILKAFLKGGEEGWEAPQAATGKLFQKGTVYQTKKKTGEVKVLQKPEKAGVGGTAADQIKEISNQYRNWLTTEKSIAMGGLDNPMLAMAMRDMPADSPFVQAFQKQDLAAMQEIARKARQYWEDKFEEARIKSEYPNAKKDQYGWYVEKDGKKYQVVVE